jgi:hypothetical protein
LNYLVNLILISSSRLFSSFTSWRPISASCSFSCLKVCSNPWSYCIESVFLVYSSDILTLFYLISSTNSSFRCSKFPNYLSIPFSLAMRLSFLPPLASICWHDFSYCCSIYSMASYISYVFPSISVSSAANISFCFYCASLASLTPLTCSLIL